MMGVLTIISLVIAIVAMIRIKDQERAFKILEKKVECLQHQLTIETKLPIEVPLAKETSNGVILADKLMPSNDSIPQKISQETIQIALPPQSVSPSKNSPITSAIISETLTKSAFEKTRSPAPDESSPDVVTSLLASAKNWFFGENLIVRVGALVLLVGVVLLLKLASQYIHVSIANRMLAVATAGLMTIAIGYHSAHNVKRNRKSYGLTLQGVGFAIIYLTVFVSFRLYHLLALNVTFILLAIVAGMTVLLSVRQNALPLAVMAFGGAFFAPILVSNPNGSVVMLFSYYLLLNIAVAVIAHYRTWKLLNTLSLFVTFGLAYVWGFGQYVASHSMAESGVTQSGLSVFEQNRWQLLAILLGHMVLYLFIAIRYSQQVVAINVANALPKTFAGVKNVKPSLRPLLSIDAGLVLGTAILGFGLLSALLHDLPSVLAISSGALSVVYLGLGFWLLTSSRHSQRSNSQNTKVTGFERFYNSYQLLVETILALGVAFLVLVIPLALSAHWVSVGWAIQGASLVWLGQRTARQWTVWFGLLLQTVTALMVLDFDIAQTIWLAILDTWHIAHALPLTYFSATLPLVVLTLALGVSAFVLRRGIKVAMPFIVPIFTLARQNRHLLSPLKPNTSQTVSSKTKNHASVNALTVSLVIATGVFYLDSVYHWVKNVSDDKLAITLAIAVALTVLLLAGHWLHARCGWLALRQVSRVVLPFAMALWAGVWLVWSPIQMRYAGDSMIKVVGLPDLTKGLLGIVGVLAVAKWFGMWLISRWYNEGVKTFADQLVWLLVLVIMATSMLASINFANRELSSILMILPSVLAGLGLIALRILPAKRLKPLKPLLFWLNTKQLLRDSTVFLLPAMWLWLMVANFTKNGQLLGFYMPLLNPLDITLLAILGYLYYQSFIAPATNRTKLQVLFAIAIFWTVSSLLVRSFASFLGSPMWNDGAWHVGEVQTGLTILWSIVAMALMFFASKQGVRVLWFTGVSLLGLVIIKLVMVDMSHTGAILRVVSFIGAGVLMLVIGYLAPLPPLTRQAMTRNLKKSEE